jgi:hypothetical protein
MMPAMRPLPAAARAGLVAALVLGLAAVAGAGTAWANPKTAKKAAKDRYHFQLATVRAQAGVEGKLAADALRLLEAEVSKTFAGHPQMAPDLTGAPDPGKDPKGFARWLKAKKIKGAYLVLVDLTHYREELEDSPTGGKRIVVRVEMRMFGETIPQRKMAFEGHGSATIKQDVGKKVRDRDREVTIHSAIELAVAEAMAESFHKLSLPPAKPTKK